MKIWHKKSRPQKYKTYYYFLGVLIWKKTDKLSKKICDILSTYQNIQTQNLKNEFMTWFSYSTDLTKLPKPSGATGIMQEANVIFFKEISNAFEKHHISYSIWAGTLIGALRHKGFIPWDDDIDLLVPDEDYQKIEQVIKTEFKHNPNVYTTNGDCIRIYYRGTSMQIDCFSFLTYHNFLEKQEDREKLKDKIMSYYNKCVFDGNKISIGRTMITSEEQIYKWEKEVLIPNPHEQRKMLISRIGISGRPQVYDYDWVFPLKKMEFNGYEFYAPNKPEILCYAQYGDYMKLPSDFHIHEDIARRITPQSIDVMMTIIKKKRI